MTELDNIQKNIRKMHTIIKVAVLCIGISVIAALLCLCIMHFPIEKYVFFSAVDKDVIRVCLYEFLGSGVFYIFFLIAIKQLLRKELNEGTPFTLAGYIRMKHLGYVIVGFALLFPVIEGIFDVSWFFADEVILLIIGMGCLLLSGIIRYGAFLETMYDR